ncbi:MAG TPA: SDR family oxidoreductase [Acidimicrobiales bacterium]|nr:SDR family oxidoreductase [Acidimicrobiales bacterium]
MSGDGGVIVTGISRRIGIGAEVGRVLADAGWRVFATGWKRYDASMPWGSDTVEISEVLGSTATAGMEADLADPAVPMSLFDAAEEAIGPIRALVNVHTYDPGGGILDIDGPELDRHLAVNVRGTYLLCREFVQRYRPESGAGRIVNFLSGPPLTGSVAYATSKGAVHWMTLSIAGEVAPMGITVNAINPGPTDTGWMSPELRDRLSSASPIGRTSTPRDAANLVRFLLSDEGGWVTAQMLQSDGGFSQLAHP